MKLTDREVHDLAYARGLSPEEAVIFRYGYREAEARMLPKKKWTAMPYTTTSGDISIYPRPRKKVGK